MPGLISMIKCLRSAYFLWCRWLLGSCCAFENCYLRVPILKPPDSLIECFHTSLCKISRIWYMSAIFDDIF
jgi:hypothetical protein